MGVSRMTGTAWHVVNLSSKEKKRNKASCEYYVKEENYCRLRFGQCWGTHYCTKYKYDPNKINSSKKKTKNSKPKVKKIKPSYPKDVRVLGKFNEIKKIYLKDINMDNLKSSNEQIKKQIESYKKNKCFYAPVYLHGIEDNKYLAVCNVEIILAAKELNIQAVYCKYLSEEEAIKENVYREVGRSITHKTLGNGKIIGTSETELIICFENGEINELSFDYCYKNGLISID